VSTLKPFLIIGSGAMACLFAARIKAAGNRVTILDGWEEGLAAIRASGISITDDKDTQTVTSFSAINNVDSLQENISFALVLVKSWQTAWAAQQIKNRLAKNGIVLTLQNGLGNYEILTKELGIERTAIGVTTMGAKLLAPGSIQSHENGEIILAANPHLKGIKVLLEEAGFRVRIEKNINQVLWGKLILNTAVNPLSALLEVPNGELLSNPYSNQLIHLLVDEALRVAEVLQISLPYENPHQHIEDVLQATAGNFTSMYQDIKRGAKTEIDAINGAIIRLGEENDIDTPVNKTIYLLIKALLENQ
jgi:2-dehydropantoate 2-reductase